MRRMCRARAAACAVRMKQKHLGCLGLCAAHAQCPALVCAAPPQRGTTSSHAAAQQCASGRLRRGLPVHGQEVARAFPIRRGMFGTKRDHRLGKALLQEQHSGSARAWSALSADAAWQAESWRDLCR